MSKFLIGASYYPEWWSEERWESDFSKMAELGFNAVRMGEFAWTWYEPHEGEYNFEPMRRAIRCAERHGIRTVLGTPTAVCPPWLARKFPHVKGGNERGDYDFGGRKGNCLSNRIFLEYAAKIVAAQAEALGDESGIAGWQLDNEPGFPFLCYDDECEKGFRQWLRERYGNDIGALNKAWFNMFSNEYTDFDEICLPVNAAEGGWAPGIQLDYRRYFSFIFLRLLRQSAELIRPRSPGRFIYTNWPGANWSVSCEDATEFLDYSGWDNYVGQPQGEDYRVQLRASLEHSLCRRHSMGKGRFVVAEQKSYADPDNVPEVIRAQTWLNVSHGAFTTIFFEWRMPLGGPEQGYDSVLGPDGEFTECAPVFKKLTADIHKIYDKYLDGASTRSDVAAVYSYESSWSTPGWRVDGSYDEELFCAHGGFKNALGVNTDVVTEHDGFEGYRLLVAPDLRLVTDETAERIKDYVRNGGIIVLNCASGTHDEHNLQRELLFPGAFAELCGAGAARRMGAGRLGSAPAVRYADGSEAKISGAVYDIELRGAEAAAVYTCGAMKGKPAVTVNAYGKGYAVLCGTDACDTLYYEALAKYIAGRFGFAPLAKASDGVLLAEREKGADTVLFAINMKNSAGFVELPPCTELITGSKLSGKVTLEGYGVAVALVSKE